MSKALHKPQPSLDKKKKKKVHSSELESQTFREPLGIFHFMFYTFKVQCFSS